MARQIVALISFALTACSAAGKIDPGLPVRFVTLQPIAVGVSVEEANRALAEAQIILKGANVELMLKEPRAAHKCPETRGAVCLERDWLGYSPFPHNRGKADLDRLYAVVRLTPFLNHYNGKLIAHEIAHLLGAAHTYRGLMFPDADSLAFATGFAPESLQQMRQ